MGLPHEVPTLPSLLRGFDCYAVPRDCLFIADDHLERGGGIELRDDEPDPGVFCDALRVWQQLGQFVVREA